MDSDLQNKFDATRKLLWKIMVTRGVEAKTLSEAAGRNHAYIHQYFTKGSPRRLPEYERDKIAEFLDIPSSALKSGIAPPGLFPDDTIETKDDALSEKKISEQIAALDDVIHSSAEGKYDAALVYATRLIGLINRAIRAQKVTPD